MSRQQQDNNNEEKKYNCQCANVENRSVEELNVHNHKVH